MVVLSASVGSWSLIVKVHFSAKRERIQLCLAVFLTFHGRYVSRGEKGVTEKYSNKHIQLEVLRIMDNGVVEELRDIG